MNNKMIKIVIKKNTCNINIDEHISNNKGINSETLKCERCYEIMEPEDISTQVRYSGRYHEECAKEINRENSRENRQQSNKTKEELKSSTGGCCTNCGKKCKHRNLQFRYFDESTRYRTKTGKLMHIWNLHATTMRKEFLKGTLMCQSCCKKQQMLEKAKEPNYCRLCGLDLKEEDKYPQKGYKNNLHYNCRLKIYAEQNKRYKQKCKDFYNNAKANCGGCADCGEKDPNKLEFAHWHRRDKYRDKNGKVVGIYRLSIKAMKQEFLDGRFLCCKCHEKETKEENKIYNAVTEYKIPQSMVRRMQENREYIDQKKIEMGECVMCHEKVDCNLLSYYHLDHINPDDKLYNFSMLRNSERSKATINAELAKAQLLCKPCHRIRTKEEGHFYIKRPEKKMSPKKIKHLADKLFSTIGHEINNFLPDDKVIFNTCEYLVEDYQPVTSVECKDRDVKDNLKSDIKDNIRDKDNIIDICRNDTSRDIKVDKIENHQTSNKGNKKIVNDCKYRDIKDDKEVRNCNEFNNTYVCGKRKYISDIVNTNKSIKKIKIIIHSKSNNVKNNAK